MTSLFNFALNFLFAMSEIRGAGELWMANLHMKKEIEGIDVYLIKKKKRMDGVSKIRISLGEFLDVLIQQCHDS